MADVITKTGRTAIGCAILFALPFAAVGIGMAYWSARIALEHTAMQSWAEVPAKIRHVELKRARGDGGDIFQAVAEYDYTFNGKAYKGERVGLHSASDNVGDFQQEAFQELKRHHDAGKPFRCFVNPEKPAESILFRELRWEMVSFNSIFATAFGAAGLGMITAVIVVPRRTPAVKASDVPADEPWCLRADWAVGQIESSTASVVVIPVLTVVAVWWWIASAPLTAKLLGMLQASDSPWRWATLAFPSIGVLLVGALVIQWLRRRNYGESILQLAATPGVVGGQLAGVVRIPRTVQAAEGFRLKLSCIERTKDADNDSSDRVLWQDERLILEPMREIAAGATAVPVLFAIPFEAEETSRTTSKRDIRWQLDASAKMPGVNYKSRFEVPVFKTAESRADFKLDERLSADFAASPPRELVLREAGIVKEPLPGGGVRIVFPAARNMAAAIVTTVFLAIWSGSIWLMLSLGAPILFIIIFGLFELAIIWIVVELWFYRSVVEARSDGLTFRGGLLGIGRKQLWTADQIERFTTSESMTSGNNVWTNVEVVPRVGKQRKIGRSIGSKLAVEAVIDELNAALGRS